MKKMKKVIAAVPAAALAFGAAAALPQSAGLSVAASAEDTEDTLMSVDYEYSVNDDGTATIVEYKGSAESLEIPSEIDGKTVTSIGDSAFYGCTSLKSVTIPDSVTYIGDSAFFYCLSLTSVTVPDGVTTIGDSVFKGCLSLASVTLPDSVTTIGEEAFCSCEALTSINIPDGVMSIGDHAFEMCLSIESLNLPDTVEEIGYGAFLNCRSLSSVNIPQGVSTIYGETFRGCTSLTSIVIPEGVTRIESCLSYEDYAGAFNNCTALEKIYLPKSVVAVDIRTFTGCSALLDIYYSGSEDDWNNIVAYFQTDVRNYVTIVPLNSTVHYNTAASGSDSADLKLGDVNGDKSINANDVTLVLKYIAKMETLTENQIARADVNGSGSVNASDVTLILQYTAKMIDEF